MAAADIWTPMASVIGVVVGGGLTFAAQWVTQRTAQRTEERRRLADLANARRAERIQAITEFIRFAVEAEGVAHARGETWSVGDDWYAAARRTMDALRVAEQNITLLCTTSVHGPAARYGRALNEIVWQNRADQNRPENVTIGDHLEPLKAKFLAASRDSLDPDRSQD